MLGFKRYTARVRSPDGSLSNEYVDWFEDDDAARTGYRVILEQQGYHVTSVEVTSGSAIIDINYP